MCIYKEVVRSWEGIRIRARIADPLRMRMGSSFTTEITRAHIVGMV